MPDQGTWIRSFIIAFVVIDAVFFSVDAIGNIRPFQILYPALLNAGLLSLTFLSFRRLCRSRSWFGIEHPVSGAIGASIGILFIFPAYFALVARWTWKPVNGRNPLPDFWHWYQNFGSTIVRGGTYDGSLLALVASPIMLLIMGMRLRRTGARQPTENAVSRSSGNPA